MNAVKPYSAIAHLTLLLVAALVVSGHYTQISSDIGDGEIILPLDDTYIHFQYARQIANGQPYHYNSNDEASSGATSFIYPYLLAVGYKIGFTGLALGFWAIGIGAIALFVSSLHIYLFASRYGLAPSLAVGLGLVFIISGPVSWHFMSGMETGLVIACTLATLYHFDDDISFRFSMAATLLALSRPEASLMALTACGLLLIHRWSRKDLKRHDLLWLIPPIVAAFIQPVVNLALTGHITASGSQAKSILSTVPFFWTDVLDRIASNFIRMWREFASGTHNLYVPIVLLPVALIGLVKLLRTPQNRLSALLIIVWLLTITLAVSTLDTAFWHFKRYQMPLVAMQYMLAGIGLAWFWEQSRFDRKLPWAVATGILLISGFFAFNSAREFSRLYEVNVVNIASQPLPMARWLRANTPETAIVAVHDVGMMRYIGQRQTVDMVGLTTGDAADYWRNGPGSVAEFLLQYEPSVDYVAAYTTARGLNYLVDTSIYGELLADFTAQYDPADNVALGAEFQGIYATRFDPDRAKSLQLYHVSQILDDAIMADLLNVAELHSEAAHNYRWQNTSQLQGFVTEVYEMDYATCTTDCRVLDGGRLINGEESFTMRVNPAQDAYLVTRIHPFYQGGFEVYVNESRLASRVIPQIPGQWLDVATYIPANAMTSDELNFRIVPQINDGFYMPYRHLLVQTQAGAQIDPKPDRIASFQDGSGLDLTGYTIDYDESNGTLTATFEWFTNGTARGDYKFFVHIYDEPDESPVAQIDRYPAGSPPGNWLFGTIIDTNAVDLSDLPAGTYEIAIGFYEATSFERLVPVGSPADVDEEGGRLFITQINID